jgi:pyruvate,water dikinase
VFYLTIDEILGALPDQPRRVIGKRRALREQHQKFDIPGAWTGSPTPRPRERPDDDGPLETLCGTGVSAGVVEGTVRVVTDPTFDVVEENEILVAPTTDPSWSSIMFISAALVVDIGGALSHAAVVAREMGIPCVVSTGSGTTRLRNGDRVRVDGSTGLITILKRA